MGETPIPHGTYSGYADRKCRCDDCKAANAERSRRHYANTRKQVEKSALSDEERAERRAERQRRWRKNNADKVAQHQRRYRKNNPDKVAAYNRRYYKANAEDLAQKARRRADADPVKAREQVNRQSQTRRARKLNAFVEEVSRQEIFVRDNWRCQITNCLFPGEPIRLDVPWNHPLYAVMDHIIPLAAGVENGGTHERSNLQAAHSRCNLVKKDRMQDIESL